jgi:hypothetical protein
MNCLIHFGFRIVKLLNTTTQGGQWHTYWYLFIGVVESTDCYQRKYSANEKN